VNAAFRPDYRTAPTFGSAPFYATLGVCLWTAGAGTVFALLRTQHKRFVRSLGVLSSEANGVWRSNAVAAPMLVGIWRPRIVVPVDFEARYSADEQSLVLAHERSHLERADIWVNTAAAGFLCLTWFNPLVWVHPLTERIAMLKHSPPGFFRHVAGITVALALTLSGAYTVWASASGLTQETSVLLVDLAVTVSDSSDQGSTQVTSLASEYLVNSGEARNYASVAPFDTQCIASLPGDVRPSSGSGQALVKSAPLPAAGQILLECIIRRDRQIVATPSLITRDGEPAKVDFENADRSTHYMIEFTATASKQKIAAARKLAAERASARTPE
jgi:hypothetical protein